MILPAIILGVILGIKAIPYFPSLFQPPQVTTVTQITIEKKLTDTEIIARTKHPEQLMVIYALESSLGKNDGCKYINKFNGFGYRQNTFEHICYDTFEEVVNEVDNWLTNKDKENYCLYNVGIRTTECSYAQKAVKLLE